MLNLENKVALVTGASGGIGGAIAKLLHNLGAIVILSGTNENNLQKLSTELKDRNHILLCNLKERDQVNNLIDQAIALHSKLDILICNAGLTKDNLVMRMKEEDWRDVLDVNLTSSFILSKAVIKYMMKNKYGRIIYISSVIGLTGNAGQANYAASKAGIEAMARSIAKEVGSRNITVNSVAPGFIETAMTDVLTGEHRDNLLKSIPIGRFGKPEDIANMVGFLSSDEASYITGQTFHVNGGMA